MPNPNVRREGGAAQLTVDTGGKIKVISAGAGGSIVGSGGTRAAHISNRSVTTVTAGSVLASKANPNFSTLASGLNSVITALRSVGILATS